MVVEHDKEMMLESDYILDIGPGAGRHGGHVVAEGDPSTFLKGSSTTSKYLSGKSAFHFPKNDAREMVKIFR